MESVEKPTHWYAVKTRNESSTQAWLEGKCQDIYAPRMQVRTADHSSQTSSRPVIPKLILIRTTEDNALSLEKESRTEASSVASLWVYRFPGSDRIQPISPEEFNLFRLLTTDDTAVQCEVYGKADFRVGQRVRVIAGPFAGYIGYTRRIRNNKHVVVEIEGLCAIALPFIHPSLLQSI